MDGKPPIRQFHSSHVARGWEEFSGYNQGERDFVTKRFRDVIIASGVVPVSFAVSVNDWDKFASDHVKALFGSPEKFAFMSCVMAAHRMSAIGKQPVSIQFDAGRLVDSREDIIASAVRHFENSPVTIGFNSCAALPALQSADMIAYESYLLSKQVLKCGNGDPRPHFKRLLEGAAAAYGFIFSRAEIESFSELVDGILSGSELALGLKPDGFQNLFNRFFSVDGF